MTHYRNHNTIIPDYEANPPPLPQRRIPQQSNCGTILTSPQVTVPPMNPIPMPVFPLHNTPSKYSPYSPTRFHIDKSCQYRWSWKYCGIALILLCMALTATLIYFTAIIAVQPRDDNSNCILVEDTKVVAQNDEPSDVAVSLVPTEESITTTSTVGSLNPIIQQNIVKKQPSQKIDQHILEQQQEEHEWLAPIEVKEFDVPYSVIMPPYRFWRSEFQNKESRFVYFNFTLSWTANFAIYCRRGAPPSITNYDFLEFVKGGRVEKRLKRSLTDNDLFNEDNESNSVNVQYPHALTISFNKSSVKDSKNILHIVPVNPAIIHNDNNVKFIGKAVNTQRKSPSEFGMSNLDHLPSIKLAKRSADDDDDFPDSLFVMVNVSLLLYLDAGRWFTSVYNDDLRPQNITLIISEAEGISTACPNDCSGHGSCYLGKCDCIDGHEGIDCSKSVCPVLCSNHGKYGGGLCHCEEGWKGTECDVPEHDCQVPDCSGNGQCINGICVCSPGWQGPYCNQADCPDPLCSSHGKCVMGKCYCKAGWQGMNCSDVDPLIYKCLPGCSDHGIYDLHTKSCMCDSYWTGADCSKELCNLDCGLHGLCNSGKCECDPGWTGDHCDLLPCDSRCAEHGQCKNGTCVCSQGWNGRHCTLSGCKNSCNHHGTCTFEDGEYHCVCSDGWGGIDCAVHLEMDCNDDVDNDKDGMTDCSDSECCSHPVCADHIMCLASNDPVEVLLRKQPPSVTASFYQRLKFLIEENSVQSYAHMDEYSESRVSVMRGQVISPLGLGIVGVRVSVDRGSRFGFTLTRAGGWFDVMVNGGGAVTLQFQRLPFRPVKRTVYVPWNEIVDLAPIVMQLSSDNNIYKKIYSSVSGLPITMEYGAIPLETPESTGPCKDHDTETLHPVIVPSWMPEKVGGIPGRSVVFAETQILQESIPIPGSGLHLMYHSSQAAGYMSTIFMRLTHDVVPHSLIHVHVRVEIEGSLYFKTYESDPNITHVFAWNKRNVYKQKVYGVAQAKISVGYQYKTCPAIVWETQTAMLKGFDVDISDIGGWNLDIHHHYNFHDGILQKGDGTTMHFKQFPRVVKIVMGTGAQRSLDCLDCNGPAKDSRLLSPVALTSGPDGSLYVGDFNLVRRITPDGNVYTVLRLRATKVSYQYYICISPADGHLYISDSEKRQVLRVLSLDNVGDPSINFEPVVGSGQRCIPGDDTFCGDEGPAKDAKLSHPKGLAITADNTMYIADATNIRAVDPNGIIHTIVGHHSHLTNWVPIPCEGAVPAEQVQLQWPTGLSLSPLDGSLYFIDDHLVLKLTDDLKVKVVAGTPLHCCTSTNDHCPHQKTSSVTEGMKILKKKRARNSWKATSTSLGSVLSIAFSPTGDLFISEYDSRKVNTVHLVDTSGRISVFSGRPKEKRLSFNICECTNGSSVTTTESVPSSECQCGFLIDESSISEETMLSSNIHLKIVSALTVTPNGVLYVVDQENLHILSMEHYLPAPDESGEYRIPYPPTSEIYVFNKYGQHIATKDLTSGNTVYSFLYSKNTSFGKLSTVTDSSGNKIQFLRDYSNVVTAIENRQNNHKCDLKISNVGFLVRFVEKGIVEVELDYDSNSGLLTSRANLYGQGAGEAYIYNYGVYGRLSDIVLPTGETVNINSKLTFKDGLAIDVIAFMQSVTHVEQEMDQQNVMTLEMEEQDSIRLVVKEGVSTMEAVSLSNGTYSVNLPCGVQLQGFSVVQHPLLELSLPVEAEMLPMWNHQFLKMGDDLINIMQWTYKLVGDVRKPEQTLQRELWVNHSRVLGIEYDQTSKKETFYDHDKTTLLVIKYDSTGLPHVWTPIGESPPVNITYDIFKRSDEWKWGIQSEKYSYDNHGLLSDISTPKDGITHFSYNKLNKLSEIILPSERKFDFQYDDDGGLRHVVLPSGTKHSFSCQPSIGFLRVTYTPPGSTKPYIQHYSHSGSLLKTVFPSDGPRILYRYYSSGQLAEVVHGDGRSQINYSPATKFPNEVLHSGRDFEYRWGYQYTAALLTEERIDFVAKTGLSSAKFTYEYDTNFRLTAIQGRIGGQTLSEHSLRYNYKTGAPEQMGPFKISKSGNETALSDGIAFFSRIVNPYFQQIKISVTIHRMEVFRMEFAYDPQSRISQTRTNTRNVGINSYSNVKNYTWDSDGQLVGVEAQEPWGFKYDANGNMLSLNYRGNAIPMEYNEMDRIVKFGEGVYHYDNRGYVIQNAREEKFHYNAKGLLVRAVKRGRFDVRYYYDHLDRLSTRKDNYGNVTQFFYTNHQKPYEVSQIYSPRDGKLMSLIYDDSGHLIYAQVYRHKYYVATDQCGTPVMVFNQYGEGIREIMRSPYGHIVYDSNPYLYLPIDFCGGLLDQVTSLVHMSNGKVYDPLIGQWMTPMWEGILDRIANPSKLHLYRINGNDPVNMGYSFKHLTGYHSWFTVLGYDLKSLAPQLYLDELLNNDSPSATRQGGLVGLFSSDASKQTISMSMPELTYSRSSIQLNKHPLADNFGVASGFYTRLSEYHLQEKYSLSSYLESKKTNWPPNDFPTKNPASVFSFQGLGAASDPPFGKGVLVSCTSDGRTIVRSVPSANPIYRDVFTSVFNQTFLLPFTLIHNGQQDVFYFVKEEMWRADEDKAQLKRLSGQINTTFHEKDVGSAETGLTAGKFTDFKIHGTSAIINLRYGTTTGKEKQRLLHHVKGVTARKAWHREKEIIKNGYIGAIDWSTTETDEILKSGSASNYETEYIHDIQSYPEMAEDSFNIRFVKKTVKVSKGSGKQHRQRRNVPFNEETGNISHNSTSTTVKKTDSNDAQKHVSSPEVTIRKKYSNEELRKCKHSPWWLWFPWIKKEYTC